MPLTLRSKRTLPYNPNLAGRAGRCSQQKDDSELHGTKTRAKRLQEDNNIERRSRIKLSVPTVPATPPKDELLELERATRGANPTCLHFGIDIAVRRARYPNYFFCNNCDLWATDALVGDQRKRISRDSRAYKCTALHTSFISPTTKIKEHHTLKILDFDEAASDSDESEATSDSDESEATSDSDESEAASNNIPSPSDLQWIPRVNPALRAVTPGTSGQNQQVRPQQLRYGDNASSPNASSPYSTQANSELMQTNETDSLKAELEQLYRDYSTLLDKHAALVLKQSDSPKEMTVRAIKSVINKSKDLEKKQKKQVEQFVAFILENSFFDGLVRREIFRRVTTYLREEVFTPWALLKEMDTQGHKLSLQAVEVVRVIQVRNQRYSRDCVFPSSSTIQRVAAIVETYAKPRIPYTISNLPQNLGGGEIISFDDGAVIRIYVLNRTNHLRKLRLKQLPRGNGHHFQMAHTDTWLGGCGDVTKVRCHRSCT
jgi:hypothetical protein